MRTENKRDHRCKNVNRGPVDSIDNVLKDHANHYKDKPKKDAETKIGPYDKIGSVFTSKYEDSRQSYEQSIY